MKKSLLLMVSAMAGFALASDVALQPKGKTFPVYTEGPDLYADGTTVLNGERYALVWVAENSTFGGFNTDFSLVDPVNNKIITTQLFAKNGKLDEVGVVIPEGFVADGGTFHLFVMDTRVPAGSATGLILNGYGVASVVNNSGSSSNCMGATVAGLVSGGKSSQVTAGAQLSSDVAKPVIKSIEVKNGKVYVTVEKTSAKAYYNVQGAKVITDGGNFGFASGTKGQQGGAETVTFEYPVATGAQFFKAVGGTSAQTMAK